jgi:hypothetical protein
VRCFPGASAIAVALGDERQEPVDDGASCP